MKFQVLSLKNVLILLLFWLSASKTADYYSLDSKLNLGVIKEGSQLPAQSLAIGQFIDDRSISGWTYYLIKTNGEYPDWLQAYAAGYMEGYLAYNLIWAVWNNLKVNNQHKGLFDMPGNVTEFLQTQLEWTETMIQENPTDFYWNLVNATLAQLYGMYDGFIISCQSHQREDLVLSFDKFYLITYAFDLADVLAKYTDIDIHQPRCSFLLKLTPENLFVGHTTWGDYAALLRTYKVIELNLNNPLVHTKKISLSSQPGAIPSLDDFYIVDNNRVVAETTLESANKEVFSFLSAESLPYWIRVTVATLGFTDQKSWVDLYLKYRSGTYNNQWLLIDFNNYNKFKGNLVEAENIVWIAEEFYNLTSAKDVTQELLIPQGYVASYNTPLNSSIQSLSQGAENYTSNFRYHLFEKYSKGIDNIEDFKTVMRLNNISDTGNYCQAIASRCDLNKTFTVPAGAYDCKITDNNLISEHQAWIISSPSTNLGLPPFAWRDWPSYKNNLAEMSEIYDFDWVFFNPKEYLEIHTMKSQIVKLDIY